MCNCALITDLHSRAVFVLIVSAWRSVNIFIDRSFKGYSGFFWAVSLLAYKFVGVLLLFLAHSFYTSNGIVDTVCLFYLKVA